MLSQYLSRPAHRASHREGTLRIAFPSNGRVPYTFAGSGLRAGIPSDNLGLPLDRVAIEPSTICDAIRVHAALDPERPAIVCTDLPALTFGDLDRTIRQIGDELKAAGITAASRVGIVLPNGPEAAVVAIAVCAHAVCFPLNAALSESEFEFELTRARLDAVVVPAWVDVPAMNLANARALSIFRVPKATSSLADVYLDKVGSRPLSPRQPAVPSAQSVSVIQMSSGSTGTPKLILVTHANLFDVAGKVQTLVRPDRQGSLRLPVANLFGIRIKGRAARASACRQQRRPAQVAAPGGCCRFSAPICSRPGSCHFLRS